MHKMSNLSLPMHVHGAMVCVHFISYYGIVISQGLECWFHALTKVSIYSHMMLGIGLCELFGK